MKRRRTGPGERLALEMRRSLGGFDGRVRIEAVESTDWQSVTFAGARHRLLLHLEGAGARDAADTLLARFPEADFVLPGHLLAEIRILTDRCGPGAEVELEVQALTVETGPALSASVQA